MRPSRLAPLALVLLAACGDALVDHRNVELLDVGGGPPTSCDVNQVQCPDPAGPAGATVCRSQVPGEVDWVCGTSCEPCPAAGVPANATVTCTPTGVDGHDGVCGFACASGFLQTATGCAEAKYVAAGGAFSCATTADRTEVHCWGDNSAGQLGDSRTGEATLRARKVPSGVLTDVVSLAAGPAHACAAVTSGTTTAVYCWGDATGYGGVASGAVEIVEALAGSVQLAAGARHTCGVTAAREVKCTGAAADGGGASPLPGANVLEVAAGDRFSCALVSAGAARSIQCWGANDVAQLGRGTATLDPQPVPAPVSGTTGTLIHVAAGKRHACTANDGRTDAVQCWGDNSGQQAGASVTGTPVVSATPNTRVNKAIVLLPGWALAAGEVITCAVLDDGLVRPLNCWGGDPVAAGGDLPAGEENHILGADGPGELAIGARHGCFVASDARLWCWGHNESGQLGDGGTTSSSAPVLVVGR